MVPIHVNGSSFLTSHMSAVFVSERYAGDPGKVSDLCQGNEGNPRQHFLDSLSTRTYPSSHRPAGCPCQVQCHLLSQLSPFNVLGLFSSPFDLITFFFIFQSSYASSFRPFQIPNKEIVSLLLDQDQNRNTLTWAQPHGRVVPSRPQLLPSTERLEERQKTGTREGCQEH